MPIQDFSLIEAATNPVRAYIGKITERKHKQALYDFKESVEGAWFWTTKEEAESVRQFLSEVGIKVYLPSGNCAPCTDFCVEPRPEGGFAISCEHPSVLN